MSASVYAQYQSPGTGSPTWNGAIINDINSNCAFQAKMSATRTVNYVC